MTTEARKPGNPGPAILAACGLILGGMAFHAWQTHSTPGFRQLGTIWALMMTGAAAVVVVPVSLIAALVASWLHDRGRLPRWLGSRRILVVGALLLATCIGYGLRMGSPQFRLVGQVPVADGLVSDVQAVGFDSFLARRWLYPFHVAPADAARIASALGLQESKDVDLRRSLERDVFFSGRPLSSEMAVPEGTRGYVRTSSDGPDDQSVEWITMAVSERDQRAWLYVGYKN